jgi:cytoskeleton protein RodZ
VLALMPPASGLSLESGNGGLNAPFRDRPGRDEPGLSLGAIRPMVLGASVLMLAAVALIFVPDGYWTGAAFRAASLPAASAASTPSPMLAPAPASAVNADGAASAAEQAASVAAAGLFPPAEALPPLAASTPAAAASVAVGSEALAASAPAGLLQVRTAGVSWVDVRDGGGRVLVSRVVQAGERLEIDGPLPLRLTIGNAAVTRLDFRGRAVDLAPGTRDNVARIELK